MGGPQQGPQSALVSIQLPQFAWSASTSGVYMQRKRKHVADPLALEDVLAKAFADSSFVGCDSVFDTNPCAACNTGRVFFREEEYYLPTPTECDGLLAQIQNAVNFRHLAGDCDDLASIAMGAIASVFCRLAEPHRQIGLAFGEIWGVIDGVPHAALLFVNSDLQAYIYDPRPHGLDRVLSLGVVTRIAFLAI